MRNPIIARLVTGIGIVVAALVVAGGASAADGAVRPDDRANHGPGAVARTNVWVAGALVARPDDRATHGPGAIEAARRDAVLRPDDRADRRLPGAAPVAQPTSGEGFDWIDAGVGAAVSFGLVLLIAGGSVLRLRHRTQTA